MKLYSEIIKGKLIKYTEEGFFRWETWELEGYLFKCYWWISASSDFNILPMTIRYEKL